MEFLVQVQCKGMEYSLSQCVLETVNFDNQTTDVAAVQCISKYQMCDKKREKKPCFKKSLHFQRLIRAPTVQMETFD